MGKFGDGGKRRSVETVKKSYVGRVPETTITLNGGVHNVSKDILNKTMSEFQDERSVFQQVEPNYRKRNVLPSYSYNDDVIVTLLPTGSLIINSMIYHPDDMKTGITINKSYYSLEDIYNKLLPKDIVTKLPTKIDTFLHNLAINAIDTRTVDDKIKDHFSKVHHEDEKASVNNSIRLINNKKLVANNSIRVNKNIDVESSCILDIENQLANLDSIIKEFIRVDSNLKFSKVSRFPINDRKINSSNEPFYPYLCVEWVVYNLNKLHIDNSGYNTLFKKNSLLEDSDDLTMQTYGDASLEESLFRLLFNLKYLQDTSLNYYKDITIITKVGNEIRSITSRFYLLPTFITRLDSNDRPYVHIETNGTTVRYNNISLSNRPSYIDTISIGSSDKELEDNMIAFIRNDIRINNIINIFMQIADEFTDMFKMHRTKILEFDFERGNIQIDIKQDIHNFRYHEALDKKEVENDYEC